MALSGVGCHIHKSICLLCWQECDKKRRAHQCHYFPGLEEEKGRGGGVGLPGEPNTPLIVSDKRRKAFNFDEQGEDAIAKLKQRNQTPAKGRLLSTNELLSSLQERGGQDRN